MTACGDEGKDHICDTDSACTVYSTDKNTHADTDKDHNCDYGCSELIGVCEDTDKNHSCDYGCGKEYGEHADGADNDHLCDYGCGKTADAGCHDATDDGDHKCDVCGADNVSDHTYADATCTVPETCTECGATEGDALGHKHDHYGRDEDNHWSICACGEIIENTTAAHEYTDNKCVCGATQVEVVFMDEETVIPYTVKGRTVTVTYDMACRVGYWDVDEEIYIAITAEKNEDGSYSFTAPEDVTEVLIVITGDTNGDGKVSAPDIARLNAHIKANGEKVVMTPEQLFAADVNYDERLDAEDKNVMANAILSMKSLDWEAVEVVE